MMAMFDPLGIQVATTLSLDRQLSICRFSPDGTTLFAEGSGAYGTPLLLSKPLAFGDPGQEFFLSDIRVIHEGTLTVTVGLMDDLNETTTWLPAASLADNWDNVEVFRTARFFRIKIEGATAWRVTSVLFYGKAMGYRL